MKRNRVVITGMGILAPNGIGIEAFWESILAGRSGIGPITLFDASKFPTTFAAQVKNFDLSRYLPEARPGLLVTCDCGTSDHDRLEWLRARHVESIVVDHHKVPDDALPAVAFLNPHRAECGFPYKGLASYFTVEAGGRPHNDIAWTYESPIPECPKIEQAVAFFNERVDLIVDGERLERPQTQWSKPAS